MRGFSTFPYISSINSKYKRSHSLSGPPVVTMKKEMTELENKIKLLKLKIAKTEEIIHKRERQALERLPLSISSLGSAVELKLTRRLHGRNRGMRKQLTQIVQLQSTSSTGKLRKMARDYQKDKSVI